MKFIIIKNREVEQFQRVQEMFRQAEYDDCVN